MVLKLKANRYIFWNIKEGREHFVMSLAKSWVIEMQQLTSVLKDK